MEEMRDVGKIQIRRCDQDIDIVGYGRNRPFGGGCSVCRGDGWIGRIGQGRRRQTNRGRTSRAYSDHVESVQLAKLVTPGPMCASRPRPGVHGTDGIRGKHGFPALGVKRTWVRQ